jgi:hypothetical protein
MFREGRQTQLGAGLGDVQPPAKLGKNGKLGGKNGKNGGKNGGSGVVKLEEYADHSETPTAFTALTL